MKKTKHRAGVIRIDQDLLLGILDFKGGELLGVRGSPPFYLAGVEIAIKHKDMPIVPEGGRMPVVMPLYYKYKNGRVRRIKEKYG